MLNLIASILSIFLIKDPVLILERNLVKIERNTYSTCRGLIAALGATRNADRINIMAENSTKGFCLGLIAFFTATKILFTPLPIFLSRDLALQESIIYAYFCIVYAEVCIVLERKIGYLAEGELSTYPVVYEDLVKEEGGS